MKTVRLTREDEHIWTLLGPGLKPDCHVQREALVSAVCQMGAGVAAGVVFSIDTWHARQGTDRVDALY